MKTKSNQSKTDCLRSNHLRLGYSELDHSRLNHSMMVNTSSIVLGGLMGITLLSGLVLSSSLASADTDSVDEVTITVPTSCSMSSTGTNSHTAELGNGQSNSTIGETTITTNCNDNEGFAIYAIGYTGDTLGNNKLTSTSLGSTHDIVTGTATSGNTSNWAMKLSTISSPAPNFPITIAGSTADTLKEQGDPDYSTFQQVPDDYTKVAYRTSSTDVGTNAEGSILKTTYQAYISPTQSAGTYQGKVKYVLIYPSTDPAPTIPIPGIYTLSRADNGESRTQIGQPIPNDVETYDTPDEAMDAWEDTWGESRWPFYLKHIVSNDTITESYVGFTITSEEASQYEGLVAGNFALRGGVDESELQNKLVFTANMNTLKTVLDYIDYPDRCDGDDDYFSCTAPNGRNYTITSEGEVGVYDSMWCRVQRSEFSEEDRSSSCEYH